MTNMMHFSQKFAQKFANVSTIAALVLGSILLSSTAQAKTPPTPKAKAKPLAVGGAPGLIACAYNPDSGKPNPLGMRAFVTAIEINGDTTFTYEQFPGNVGVPGSKQPATIAQQRKLTFYGLSVVKSRELMLSNAAYYEALIGAKDPDGYKPIDAVLLCKNADGSTIGAGSPGSATNLESLPDGDYRYWSGTPRTSQISEETLLKQGGVLFVFQKKGDRVLGNISPIDGEVGACVEGTVTGNTVSGFATSYQPEKDVNKTEDFAEWGSPDGVLKVRRGKAIGGNRVKYMSALLNLNTYSKIDFGKSKVPKNCPK
jgi:hypothetical protein